MRTSLFRSLDFKPTRKLVPFAARLNSFPLRFGTPRIEIVRIPLRTFSDEVRGEFQQDWRNSFNWNSIKPKIDELLDLKRNGVAIIMIIIVVTVFTIVAIAAFFNRNNPYSNHGAYIGMAALLPSLTQVNILLRDSTSSDEDKRATAIGGLLRIYQSGKFKHQIEGKVEIPKILNSLWDADSQVLLINTLSLLRDFSNTPANHPLIINKDTYPVLSQVCKHPHPDVQKIVSFIFVRLSRHDFVDLTAYLEPLFYLYSYSDGRTKSIAGVSLRNIMKKASPETVEKFIAKAGVSESDQQFIRKAGLHNPHPEFTALPLQTAVGFATAIWLNNTYPNRRTKVALFTGVTAATGVASLVKNYVMTPRSISSVCFDLLTLSAVASFNPFAIPVCFIVPLYYHKKIYEKV